MTRRITVTALALAALIGLAQGRLERPVNAQAVPAYPLNPAGFTSLGASPFASGTYTVNTSKNNAAPVLTGPGITTPIAGIFFSPSGGTVAQDEIAVFTFATLSIPAGVTVRGAQNANSRPMALLSQSTATVAGTINVSGARGMDSSSGEEGVGDGGAAGPGGGGGGGGGNGATSGGPGLVEGDAGRRGVGGSGGSVWPGGGGGGARNEGAGGGAFGGAGGGVLGGDSYGDLSVKLQGGSGGGGGGLFGSGGGGGGGGAGAVEIGSADAMTIGGMVLANGGSGGSGIESGGGAGGGILIHAPTVSLSGSMSAIGGASSGGLGGAGGGGRVLILTADGTLENGTVADNVAVSNGVSDLHASDLFNRAPVARCRNVTVTAGPSCAASPSIDDGSSDPDTGDTLTLTQLPAGPLPLGTTAVALTVTDAAGASSSCSANVTVLDQTAPIISLKGANPLTLECSLAFVDPGATVSDNCSAPGTVTASGSVNTAVPGSYTLTYSTSDSSSNATTATRTVNVVDTAVPTLTLKPSMQLWPPNHKLITLTTSQMAQSVSDACNKTLGLGAIEIEKVTSDEPDNAPGDADGNTTNDIVIGANCDSLQLRAERAETGNGRVYVITLRVRDAAGNTTRQDFKVSVPTVANGVALLDTPPAQTKVSSCR